MCELFFSLFACTRSPSFVLSSQHSPCIIQRSLTYTKVLLKCFCSFCPTLLFRHPSFHASLPPFLPLTAASTPESHPQRASKRRLGGGQTRPAPYQSFEASGRGHILLRLRAVYQGREGRKEGREGGRRWLKAKTTVRSIRSEPK